jgi:TonB family protein
MAVRLLTLFFLIALLVPSWTNKITRTVQGDTAPRVLAQKAPPYEAIALALHADGTVHVEVTIDSEGKVLSAEVISGHPVLRKASRTAALEWRFEPITAASDDRKATLTFEFYADYGTYCIQKHGYHVKIYRPDPPETISYIDEDKKQDRCKVHGEFLVHDKVKITYGLTVPDKHYAEIQPKRFPNAYSTVDGGCVIEGRTECDGSTRDISPKYAEVLYCWKCRQVKADWIKRHKGFHPIY